MKISLQSYKKNNDSIVHGIFYIHKNELEYKDIADNSLGFIEYHIFHSQKIISIQSMFVCEKYRGNGLGTKLLQHIMKSYDNIYKNYVVELDDMSDKAWHRDNIYLKNGFKYINEYPQPEMELRFC